MPRGEVPRLRRTIAGALVLAVLLFAAAPSLLASASPAHDHQGKVATMSVATSPRGTSIPAHQVACCDGLACCLGSQCTAVSYWMPSSAIPSQPQRLSVVAVMIPARTARLAGIAPLPEQQPPRPRV